MARRRRGNARGRSQPRQDTFTVEGLVEVIDSRKWGRNTLYNVELDDGESYGFGRDLEDVEEGDTIRFEAYENDKGYLTKQDGTVELTEAPSDEPQGRSRSRNSGRKGSAQGKSSGRQRGSQEGSKREEKRRSAQSIQYADALDRAIRVLNFQVTEGMVNLGAKNKTAEREQAYWGLLDQLTAQFYEEIETQAALERAQDARSGGEDDPEDAGDPDRGYDD